MGLIKVGDPAPDFKAKDQYGKEISLSQFKGKKIILYFYPKDNTPGCTAEACNLRDNYASLTSKGFVVIGVSADSAASHAKFQAKFELPFFLIPDEEKKIIISYNAWGEKKLYGKNYEGILRKTYIIDEKSRILKIIEKVKTNDHTSQILEELQMK
jgi:thioredoxin-dependent peroxiredoxin